MGAHILRRSHPEDLAEGGLSPFGARPSIDGSPRPATLPLRLHDGVVAPLEGHPRAVEVKRLADARRRIPAMSIPSPHPFRAIRRKRLQHQPLLLLRRHAGDRQELRNAAFHPFAGGWTAADARGSLRSSFIISAAPPEDKRDRSRTSESGRQGVRGVPLPLPALREFQRRAGEILVRSASHVSRSSASPGRSERARPGSPGDPGGQQDHGTGMLPPRRGDGKDLATASAARERRGPSGTGRRSWASGPRSCGRRGSGARRPAAPRAFSAGRWPPAASSGRRGRGSRRGAVGERLEGEFLPQRADLVDPEELRFRRDEEEVRVGAGREQPAVVARSARPSSRDPQRRARRTPGGLLLSTLPRRRREAPGDRPAPMYRRRRAMARSWPVTRRGALPSEPLRHRPEDASEHLSFRAAASTRTTRSDPAGEAEVPSRTARWNRGTRAPAGPARIRAP